MEGGGTCHRKLTIRPNVTDKLTYPKHRKTRMTTFIKTNFNKLEDQTNIENIV